MARWLLAGARARVPAGVRDCQGRLGVREGGLQAPAAPAPGTAGMRGAAPLAGPPPAPVLSGGRRIQHRRPRWRLPRFPSRVRAGMAAQRPWLPPAHAQRPSAALGPRAAALAGPAPPATPCEPGIPAGRRSLLAAALAGQGCRPSSGRAPAAGCRASTPPPPPAARPCPPPDRTLHLPAAVLKKRKRDEDWAAKKVGAAAQRPRLMSQLANGATSSAAAPARPLRAVGGTAAQHVYPRWPACRCRPLRLLRPSRRPRLSARISSSGPRRT